MTTALTLEEITSIERPERNGCGLNVFPISPTQYALEYTIDYIDREEEDKGEYGRLTFSNCVKLSIDRGYNWNDRFKKLFGRYLTDGKFYRLNGSDWESDFPTDTEIKLLGNNVSERNNNLQHFILTDRDGCVEIICSNFNFTKLPRLENYGQPSLTDKQIKTEVTVTYFNATAKYLVIADEIGKGKYKVSWIHNYNPNLGQWDFHINDIISKNKIVKYPHSIGLYLTPKVTDERWWKFW